MLMQSRDRMLLWLMTSAPMSDPCSDVIGWCDEEEEDEGEERTRPALTSSRLGREREVIQIMFNVCNNNNDDANDEMYQELM